MYDALDMVNTEKVVEFVVSLQQEDGSFYGDKWGTLLITVVFCIEQNVIGACNRILPSPAPVYQVILRSESKFYNLIKICIILIVPSKKSYFDAVFLHRAYEVRQISLFNVPR